MLDPTALTIFLVASVVLLVTPGPAVLFIVARSIDQGRRAGIVSTLGIHIATLFHIAAAALGLSALLLSSALAFSIVKYAGAAYLVYLGLRKLFGRDRAAEAVLPARRRLSRVFYEGFLVNLLNPKTALFFFAFLPQFADPARGSVAAQVLVLGVCFLLLGVVSDGLYALLAGTFGNWLRGNAGFLRVERYFAGGTYVALGLTAAFADAGRNK